MQEGEHQACGPLSQARILYQNHSGDYPQVILTIPVTCRTMPIFQCIRYCWRFRSFRYIFTFFPKQRYIIFLNVGVFTLMTPLKYPSKCPICSFHAEKLYPRKKLLPYSVYIMVNLVLSLPKVVSWLEGLRP